MSSLNDELRARVNAFANELSALARESVLEEIVGALGNAGAHAPAPRAASPVKAASARPEPKVAARRKPGRPAKEPVPAPQPSPQRASEPLAQLLKRIHSYIKANPGQGVVPIATALGTSNKDLRLPIRMLVEERKVTSTGKTRGTRYFPG